MNKIKVIFVVVVSLALIGAMSAFAFFDKTESSSIYDLLNIRLGKVQPDAKAQEEMISLLQDLIGGNVVQIPGNEADLRKWYRTIYIKMTDFIRKHQNAESALTAKLVIGICCCAKAVADEVCIDGTNEVYLESFVRILQELKSTYPNTWQGKVSASTLPFMLLRTGKDFQTVIYELESLKDQVESLKGDENLEFTLLRELYYDSAPQCKDPFPAIFHTDLGCLYEEVGEFEKAIKEYHYVENNYGESYIAIGLDSKITQLKTKLRK